MNGLIEKSLLSFGLIPSASDGEKLPDIEAVEGIDDAVMKTFCIGLVGWFGTKFLSIELTSI